MIALLLCCSMLVGTTFAWFTDSVSSVNNVIKAGNLDVELYYDGDKNVQDTEELFTDVALWEPGAVAWENLTVKNVGTLALKYQLAINFVNENATSDGYSLSQILKVAVVEDGVTETDRDKLVASITDWQSMETFIKSGALLPEGEGEHEKTYGIVIYWEPSDEDNNWNVNNNKTTTDGEDYLHIDLGVNLVATQLVHEDDSFGNDYDDLAGYELARNEDGAYLIYTATDLMALNVMLNSEGYIGEGSPISTYVELMADVDMTGYEWLSIDEMFVSFDGNGYTISNLNCVPNSWDNKSGFFAYLGGGIIKDLTLENVTSTGSQAGIFAGQAEGGNIINCNVAGTNMVTWDKESADTKLGNGIGIYVGMTVEDNTISGTILEGATVVLTENDMTSQWETNVYAGSLYSGATPNVDVVDENGDSTVTGLTYVADGLYKDDNNAYAVYSAEGLMNANQVIAETDTSGERYINVNLMADVDMSGYAWTPIDTMFVNFNGNGHTISNLSVSGERSGLYAYQGGGKISNLTLENVNSTGNQAGTFVGLAAGVIENCYLKGTNTITWTGEYNQDNSGIGAICGVISGDGATINATVAAGAVVVLDKNELDTNLAYVDDLTGYLGTNNGTVTNNGEITVSQAASTNEALDAAISSGASEIVLPAGNFIIPDSAQGKTLTIVGSEDGETVIATQDDGSYEGCDYSLQGSTVVFENVTINTDSSTYTGYARLNATYNNCTINGTYTLYGDSVFNNCTFNVEGDVYNIWTWGAPNATFNGCTFNSDGKAMLLYSTVNTKLTVNNCTFNDNGGLTDLKAAIEIGNDYNTSYELIVNNTVVNGYEINDKGINTGTTLWGNKNSMSTDNLNVVVDGEDVY